MRDRDFAAHAIALKHGCNWPLTPQEQQSSSHTSASIGHFLFIIIITSLFRHLSPLCAIRKVTNGFSIDMTVGQDCKIDLITLYARFD